MRWIPLLLLTMIYHSSCDDQCSNKPCACCQTPNCNSNNTCENGCIDGFWGDQCYYPCPVHCINCEQDRPSVCDQCHDGFYNGYWHDGNSYGPWTDNCINKCSPQCKSCYYYQHCKECADGYYKIKTVENCTLPCPQRCVSCISEIDCTECKPGYYGRNCSELCSKGCDSPICDKKTGRCNCTSNYMGDTCKYCKHDKYGIDCDLDCPENCFVCNQSENCLFCKQGYEGPLCTQPITHTTQKQSTHAPEPPDPHKDNHTLSTALGTVFGIVLVVLLALALLFGWRKRQRTGKERVNEAPVQDAVSRPPEPRPKISQIPVNLDMEMSVYDEIPGWSSMANNMSAQNDLDDTESLSSDENRSQTSDENRSGVYSAAVDTSFSDHNVKDSELDDRSSNYSFATDPSNEKENKHEKDSVMGKEATFKEEIIAVDNPAFETEDSTKDEQSCGKENIPKDNLNIKDDDASNMKKNSRKKSKKGLKTQSNYEKLATGKENEHIYNQDNAELKMNIEKDKKENIAPDTPGYEKPISFKSRSIDERDDTASIIVTCEKDKVDEHKSRFEKEKTVKGKQGCDEETDVEDNLSLEKDKAGRKSLQAAGDYEDLQKVKNNEHEYEEGVVEPPDYTNVDSKAQSSATFGVFTFV